jgi:hypothetical protein
MKSRWRRDAFANKKPRRLLPTGLGLEDFCLTPLMGVGMLYGQ